MTSSREGPNPLRPYYVPPSVSLSSEIPRSHGTSLDGVKHSSAPAQSLGSSARNILSDIDYSGYLSHTSPSSPDLIRHLVEQAFWKYTSVLFGQPFDVAKTILQVQAPRSRQTIRSRDPITPENIRRKSGTQSHASYEVRSLSCLTFHN